MNTKLKIQYVQYDEAHLYNDITSVTTEEIINFDNFDYNIVDLRKTNIFLEYKKYPKTFESKMKVLKNSLNSNNSKTIILLPNQKIEGYEVYLSGVLGFLLNLDMCQIEFERNYTTIENNRLENSYYFKLSNSKLFEANSYDDTNKNKITILKKDNILITSINLIIQKISEILPILFKENLSSFKIPDWAKNINAFDDVLLKQNNENLENELKKIKIQLNHNNEKLMENNKYKSILYTNGDILHEIIKEILSDIFDYPLNDFVDIKKEDFLIELDNDLTFIGEVKGVNTNVKTQHIHQIEGRKLDYIEINPNKKACSILLINYQRDREIDKRDDISEEQIKYAKRNNCLIVTTIEFLKLYEQYKAGKITKEQIIKIFENEKNVGELKIQ